MKLFITILFVFISLCSFSQNNGYVILEQDQRIEQLIQRQNEIHSADNTIDGFRIQIFMESGNEAVELGNIESEKFKEKYPDIPVYLIFGQPYYRLRVGDFRTRLEAEKAFQTISKDYKKAFITSDRIQLPNNIFCDSTIMIEEEHEDAINNSNDIELYYYNDL
ncbi:MAG: SPOR domain-containing protein [Bacteroidales bacterium]|nr:SPOR domain-containing protein [Bacteroidales bacterium]MBO5849275.1 SPOR domain-containing protein [Bacteroidales bacterium]MBO5853535.1 SPOR domain-containing protein [Bacteroidales bacterium]